MISRIKASWLLLCLFIFIIIMSSAQNTTGAQDWTNVYEAVQWIQAAMAGLSVLGSGSIIVCLVSQRLRRLPELQPLFLLSVSDLLLATCWLVGAALFSQHSCSLSKYCYDLHTVEQILYMASFFYTLNYVWTLFKTIREKYDSFQDGYPVQVSNRVSTAGKTTALLSCVFPVLLMVPMSVLGNISQCQANFSEPYRCLLMHTGALFLTGEQQPISTCSVLNTVNIVIFLTAFFITLLGIMVFVVKARRIYRRVVTSHGYLGSEQRGSFRVLDRRMLLYPLVFIVCWGPAVSLAFLHVVKPSAAQGEAGVILYISEALTSASQGFFNSLVYGWTHMTLRRATMAAFRRDVDTQTPLLREQKKKRCYQSLRSVC